MDDPPTRLPTPVGAQLWASSCCCPKTFLISTSPLIHLLGPNGTHFGPQQGQPPP